MQQLIFNSAANVIKITIPPEWKRADLTALEIEVKNDDAKVLQASTAATLYASTTIDGAVERFATEFKLDDAATDVEIGDSLELESASGVETVIVRGYESATKIVRVEGILENAYDDGDAVRGLFASYTLDTTDTDSYKLGMSVTLLWAPAGTGHVTRTRAQISSSRLDLINIRTRFKRIHPRAYDAYVVPDDRFDAMVFEAEESVKVDLSLALMDYNRIVDQSVIIQVVMAKMAWMWTFDGDEGMNDEREFLGTQYNIKLGQIKNLPIWQDHNQDDKKDAGEETSHQPRFERHW